MKPAKVAKTTTQTRSRTIVASAGLVVLTILSGCADVDHGPSIPASGITSSNGGGMRAVGGIPDVGVSNGTATITQDPRNPRVPRY